jgi:hypothetical protein
MLSARKHAESYKASYGREKYALEKFKNYFGGRYLSDITTWAIENWKREREKQVCKATVNGELTILKHMCKMGVKWGLMTANPAGAFRRFPFRRAAFAISQRMKFRPYWRHVQS